MSAHAVANLDTTTNDQVETIAFEKPKTGFFQVFTSAKNKLTNVILERAIPDTMVSCYDDEVGGILVYEGPTVTVESPNHLGLEVRDGDLLFAHAGGVWIGTVHYSDMPEELDTYSFITSGTRSEYNVMLEEILTTQLADQNEEIPDYLMAPA